MVFRSPYPDVAVPDISLPAFVLAGSEGRAGKPALIDGPSGRTLTYEELAAGVRGAAAGLARRGLRKGDVLALFSPNLPEFPVAFHGTLAAGGVVTTVNSLNTADEVAKQLRAAGARFLVTVAPFLERALPAAASAGIEEVFVLGEAEGATPFASLLEGGGAAPRVEIDPRQDLAALPFSSGTTGLAKGVMLTHENLVANACQVLALQPMRADDVLAGVLPFFHIYGLTCVLNAALSQGATLVTLPRFELEAFLRLVQDQRVTRAYVVPPVVLALARHPAVAEYDLSSLELVNSGGAPLDAALQEACAERLGCVVAQGYGLTETSPVTHLTSSRPGKTRPGAIGEIAPSTEAKVVDVATGAELGPGEDGEILVRGPQVMKGYLNDPQATAATVDPGGWLHTGDIGHADEDGYFYVVDRLKELIKYKGYQVAPAELEALLVGHPAVADAAVVPKPDEEAGEVPKAYVVLRGETTGEELMAYVAERVAPYKRVREVEVVDEIPKSPSGKILRRVLVERERAGR